MISTLGYKASYTLLKYKLEYYLVTTPFCLVSIALARSFKKIEQSKKQLVVCSDYKFLSHFLNNSFA